MSAAKLGPVEIARSHWGDPAPDWVEVLAAQCAASNQRRVAARLGRSAGLISQALRNNYQGDMGALEDAVRGAWMGSTIDCPAKGPIGTDVCQGWRRLSGEFLNINPERGRMYRACRACPRNEKEAGA